MWNIQYVCCDQIPIQEPRIIPEDNNKTYDGSVRVDLLGVEDCDIVTKINCDIYYTLDGTAPTPITNNGHSVRYTDPIRLYMSATVSAIAVPRDPAVGAMSPHGRTARAVPVSARTSPTRSIPSGPSSPTRT